jgi:YebC/PmpR family DNA-binding regulatory protein
MATIVYMSGHSKWSKIRHRKAATDARKSQILGKLSRAITTEAKLSDGDRNSPALRTLIDKARAVNMTNETIEHAIKKATEVGGTLEAMTYEAYGPGGVGIIIDTLTGNRNKASQEIKFILGKHGASLSGQGSVTWGFKKNEMHEWEPASRISLGDNDVLKLEKLVDELEENGEIQSVATNAE